MHPAALTQNENIIIKICKQVVYCHLSKYEVIFSFDASVHFSLDSHILPTNFLHQQTEEENLLIPKSTETPRKITFLLAKKRH